MTFAQFLRSAALLGAISACTSDAADSSVDLTAQPKSLASLQGVGNISALQAPDTVFVNVPFEVTAVSWGSGTQKCNDPAGTNVEYSTGLARIEAYMIYPTGNVPCTRDLRSYSQKATVVFSTAGAATIRLIGAKGTLRDAARDSTSKSVVVMPAK